MAWIRETKKFWEASLTGDLVCGYCDSTTLVVKGAVASVGDKKCDRCGKTSELRKEVIDMAEARVRFAYPNGRPSEDGPKWKGD